MKLKRVFVLLFWPAVELALVGNVYLLGSRRVLPWAYAALIALGAAGALDFFFRARGGNHDHKDSP